MKHQKFAEAIRAAIAAQGVTGEVTVVIGEHRSTSWIGPPKDDDKLCTLTMMPLWPAAPESMAEALSGLVEAVTAEVNEKGGGGYLLARLSDARDALKRHGKPTSARE